MNVVDRDARRITFDDTAREYEAARPGYPDAMISRIMEFAGLGRDSRCLEIGIGIGQATRKLAAAGCTIVALEPGGSLASVAREALREFRNVEVNTTTFEGFLFRSDAFDLCCSATAFHWVDTGLRWQLATRALRSGGVIALLTNCAPDIDLDGNSFHAAVNRIYRTLEPGMAHRDGESTTQIAARSLHEELIDCGLYDVEAQEAVSWSRPVSRETYLQLLTTFSDHRRLPAARRKRLFSAIGQLIDDEFAGQIEHPCTTTLSPGRKLK